MKLKTTLNNHSIPENEVTITLGQDENTFTLFYKVDTDADIDGTTITHDLFIKHKSSNFKTKLKNNAGVDFPITELSPLVANTSSTGYITYNVDNNYTLLDGASYVLVINSDNTAGSASLDLWVQASSI